VACNIYFSFKIIEKVFELISLKIKIVINKMRANQSVCCSLP